MGQRDGKADCVSAHVGKAAKRLSQFPASSNNHSKSCSIEMPHTSITTLACLEGLQLPKRMATLVVGVLCFQSVANRTLPRQTIE